MRTPVFFRKHEAVANLLSMLAFLPMGFQTGKKLFRAGQYDIINTHFALPTGPVGDALARFAKVPNVLSVQGGDLYDPSKWLSPHRHWGLPQLGTAPLAPGRRGGRRVAQHPGQYAPILHTPSLRASKFLSESAGLRLAPLCGATMVARRAMFCSSPSAG